jgi:hypothetical protein
VKANNDWGIELDGAQGNNVIHHNNFINNNVTEGSQAQVAGTWTYPGLNKPRTGPFDQREPPKLIPGNANAWDDGKIGNYWSDYSARYPLASVFSSADVRGTPYVIDENNMDRYPLVNPWNAGWSLPEQQEEEALAGTDLQVGFAIAAIMAAVGLTIASACLFLRRRKVTL